MADVVNLPPPENSGKPINLPKPFPKPEKPTKPPRPTRPPRPQRPTRPPGPRPLPDKPDTTAPSPPAVPPMLTTQNVITNPVTQGKQVKPATPDVILFEDDLQPVEEITDLLFQQIGGRELINLTNKDIINSINPNTSQIGNLFKINLQYNSQNLVPLSNPSNEIINSYTIKFNDYVPEFGEGTGPAGSTVYIDENGDLVINVINLDVNEKLEIQVLNNGSVFNDTIYSEAEE